MAVFREYGREAEQRSKLGYAPLIATAGLAILGAATAKGRASRILKEFGEKQIGNISKQMGRRFTPAIRHGLEEILQRPIGYREALHVSLTNNPIMEGWEWLAKRTFPGKLLDNLLFLPDMRKAGRDKFFSISEEAVMYKRLQERLEQNISGSLIYARGGLYHTGKGRLTPVKGYEDVYGVSGKLAGLTRDMREAPAVREGTGIVSWLKHQLDIGLTEKPAEKSSITDAIMTMTGFKYFPEAYEGLEFIKPIRPAKEIKSILGDLAEGKFKRAFSRVNPGTSVSLYGKQLKLPKESLDDITAGHLMPYHMLHRINRSFESMKWFRSVALSSRSKGSFLDMYGSIFLKRALPLMVGYEAIKYANFEIGKLTGKDLEERSGDARAQAMIDLAHAKDKLGITNIVKRWNKIAPEVTQRLFHPFTEQPVGLSEEELKEYFDKGREPIRKGRWWWFGSSTPVIGDKIDYFAPNWYQRTKSKYKDYAYTETRYGSKEEYWAHNWMPTPRYPLAPIKFWTQPYWMEEKHYRDRPYPVTGKMFMDNIFGIPANLVIGNIIKPRKIMHRKELTTAAGTLKEINQQIQDRFYKQSLDQHYLYVTGGGQLTPMKIIGTPGSAGSYPFGGLTSAIPEELALEEQRYRASIDPNVHPAPYGYSQSGAGGERAYIRQVNDRLSYDMDVGPYTHEGAKYGVRRITEYINQKIASKGYRPAYPIAHRALPKGVLVPARYPSPVYASDMTPKELKSVFGVKQGTINFLEHGRRQMTDVAGIYGFMATASASMFGLEPPQIKELERSNVGSFSHAFWKDLNIAGAEMPGTELMELFRRFVPKEPYGDLKANPIENQMPSWIPRNYSIPFHQGDPYSKISMGEIRMPGAAHEKLYGIEPERLNISPSALGGSTQDIVSRFLQISHGGFMSKKERRILEGGEEAHKAVQRQLALEGTLVGSEIEIYNKRYDMRGYIDAITQDSLGNKKILEIKSKSNQKVLEQLTAPEYKHVVQLQAYMATTGITEGAVRYISRGDPTGAFKEFKVQYDPELFRYEMDKVERARTFVRNMIDKGMVTAQELYTPFERFRVLADVAPYSQEYDYYKQYLTRTMDDQNAHWEEFQTLKKEVSKKKKRIQVEPYQFKYSDIEKKLVRIEKMISPGIFKVSGMENPVRLAGIKPYGGQDEQGQRTRQFLEKRLSPGTLVQIGYTKHKENRVEKDTYGSVHVAMWDLLGDNINRYMLQKDLAKEKDTDIRPAAIHARFTPTEITAGKVIETISHLNIPYIHNKWMPIDSPLEEYKRKDVYGKRFTRWTHPVSDMILPAIKVYGNEYPLTTAAGILSSAGGGAFIGTVMAGMKEAKGWGKYKYKGIGAAIGAAVGLSVAAMMHFAGTKEQAYIPGPLQRRRDLDQYYDRLKYIKFRRLYEASRRFIKRTEGIDVEAMARHLEIQGKEATERKRYLEEMKRRDKLEGIDTSAINLEMRELAENRRRVELTPTDTLAFQFREQYKSTMYGLDVNGPQSRIYKAVPKGERDYVTHFLDAHPEEREEISRLVPEDIRKILHAKWHGDSYAIEDLDNYFMDKFLPPEDWTGWLPTRAMEDYKLATLKAEGFDVRQEGYWQDSEDRVHEIGVKDIQPNNTRILDSSIGQSIKKLYHGVGLENVIVNIYKKPADTPGVKLNAYIKHDREFELRKYVRENADQLAGV